MFRYLGMFVLDVNLVRQVFHEGFKKEYDIHYIM